MTDDDPTDIGNGDGAPESHPDPALAGFDHGAHDPALRRAGLAAGNGRINAGARINEAKGGVVSAFTCPECHGALWELREGELARYRCRVGHSYSERSLVEHKTRSLEDALWTALTALEESAAIAERAAERAGAGGRPHAADHFRRRAELIEQRSVVLRDVLGTLPASVPGNDEA